MALIPTNTTNPATLNPSTGEPFTVRNMDTANTVVIASSVGAFANQPGGVTNQTGLSSPDIDFIPPGGTAVYDGQEQKFALALSGQPPLMVSVGMTDYTQPVIPLQNLIQIPAGPSSPVTKITSGSFFFPVPVNPVIAQPPGVQQLANIGQFTSYELGIGVEGTNGEATGSLIVIIDWYYDPNGLFLADQIAWTVPVSTPNTFGIPQQIIGHGPQRGLYVGVTLRNQGSTTYTLSQFYLSGSNKSFTTDDWSSMNTGVWIGTGGFSNPSAGSFTNYLAQFTGTTIAAGATATVGLYTYAGHAHVNLATGATGTLTCQIVDIANSSAVIWSEHPADSTFNDYELYLPRQLCVFQCTNSSGTNAGSLTGSIVRDRP